MKIPTVKNAIIYSGIFYEKVAPYCLLTHNLLLAEDLANATSSSEAEPDYCMVLLDF